MRESVRHWPLALGLWQNPGVTERRTDTITKPDVRLDDGSGGDHDRFAHYVRNPVCPTCQEIMDVIRSAQGDET